MNRHINQIILGPYGPKSTNINTKVLSPPLLLWPSYTSTSSVSWSNYVQGLTGHVYLDAVIHLHDDHDIYRLILQCLALGVYDEFRNHHWPYLRTNPA
ncbi:hypothetical protein [Photobacterium damselae]|uniref:hypothetical protein n=1 Tax=Photobacterium damselae TaxID=38293 RepID=UPI0012F49668|nr:hypothetical protein [Photobacterium damselae]MBF7101136.1 hypothetical protein [Photobacterium damselae]